ncbi:MAG TPA: hypothetical protein VF702_07820 [Allosphingosinicella sp.]|jgi:hypothetical protein
MRKLTIATAALLIGGAAWAQSVDEARSLHDANRIADAERMLAAIAADPAKNAAERAAALRHAGRIAWRIDGDFARAAALLRDAQRIGEDECATAGATARLLHEAGRGAELLPQAAALAARCTEPGSADGLLLAAAAAALDAARGGAAGPLLAQAEALFASVSADGRAGSAGAVVDLRIGLLRRDPARALAAWRNYYWLDSSAPPPLGTAAVLLPRALAADAALEAQLQLTQLLVRTGFAQAAEEYAASARLHDRAAAHPAWRRAAAYFTARRALEADLVAANRAIARGRPPGDVAASFRRFKERLVEAAGGGADADAVLRETYGLVGQSGLTGGFPSLHLGHVVAEEHRTIEQYGHSAEIAFLALDNMLANGFQSWLWDGNAAVGGWTADGPVIVQVRQGYVSEPLGLWRIFGGERARTELLERQPRRAAADIAALTGRDAATLLGLADRLKLQATEQIGARARAAAGAGGDVRRAFLAEAWRASFQQSILVHEGRHAIDRRLVTGLARLDDANLEYRAKLSELALADYPRLALYNIVAGGVGDGTPHGEANANVIRRYAAWVVANRGLVAGFDAAVPAAAQLDRITDDQLRAIARSLDPIAR